MGALVWAVLTSGTRKRVRPGVIIGRHDICHEHERRQDAEHCGLRRGGVPELVALKRVHGSPLYRVVYSLSHTAAGRLKLARSRPA